MSKNWSGSKRFDRREYFGGSVLRTTISHLIEDSEEIIDLLPQHMAQVTREDAEYHAEVREQWVDLNQIETLRNRVFHEDAYSEVTNGLPVDGAILEIGCGVGYDAKRLIEQSVFGCYIVSEIDRRMLEVAKREIGPVASGGAIRFCCLDANNILIDDAQFDRVFAIAAVHHFPNLEFALSEIDRVTKAGGKIVFAIEPNRLWSSLIMAVRPIYRRIFPQKSHSAADEEAEGFRKADFWQIGKTYGWEIERVLPVWFLAGFLHQGLEFLYRMFRLRNRIIFPEPGERLLILFDRLFFRVPGMSRLAWHYTVTFKKPADRA